MAGPVFARELITAPRRPWFYALRSVYASAILLFMCTAWLVLAGTQIIRNVGDMARFGGILFQLMAPLQLGLILFFAALLAASAIAQEKDRRTLILLLMTRLTNGEIVLGKLLASLLSVLVMLASSLPLFFLTIVFGGVSLPEIARVYAVTLATALAAGSLGATLAFWREKTFQTLALTALTLIFWLGLGEFVYSLEGSVGGISCQVVGIGLSPLRAAWEAARPWYRTGWPVGVTIYLAVTCGLAFLLNAIAIMRVRVWNPSREVRAGQTAEHLDTIWSQEGGSDDAGVAEVAREGHVDAVLRHSTTATGSRTVWDNPILWREVCTWAYGRKVLVIRTAYLLLFSLAAVSLHWLIADQSATLAAEDGRTVVEATARPLVPFFFVSLVIVNALAVTAITNERDGRSLDLLLVTDISPREFVFGKIGGVLWVTKEMVILPMALCVYAYFWNRLDLGNLIFIVLGLVCMNAFVAVLGMHCGMTYANSRSAVGISLGTVFFLFLGVVTCILLMISFSGSFQVQLFPFLAFIAGGSVGLYASLGARNPSNAIASTALLLPIATFYAITSFLLGYTLGVFLVIATTYGFATASMLVPALSEFDFAMGRGSSDD